MLIALAVAVAFYLLAVAALWLLQDQMVFPGAGRGDRGLPLGMPKDAVQWLERDGVRTRLATVRPAASARAVVLYFGGNGEDLHAASYTLLELVRYGVEAIAAEHPGFGGSSGSPSVSSLLANADAAAAVARARAEQLGVPFIVVGSSLGSFCAVHAAAGTAVDRLVLRAPPSRLADVAKRAYPWLPVGLLLRHAFDNEADAAKVRCSALVVHGTDDTIVPSLFGEQVSRWLPQSRFVLVPGAGHNDLSLHPDGPVGPLLREFLFGQ